MCMSVGCDFYQTCRLNSINLSYRTKHKFDPKLDGDICISYSSGKNTKDYSDNCYPNLVEKIVETYY